MDASVEFLLQTFSIMLKDHLNLIWSAKSELKQLQNAAHTLSAILKAAPRKYEKDELFKNWESEFMEALYQVDDIIDCSITQTAAMQHKNPVSRFLSKVTDVGPAKQVRDAFTMLRTLHANHKLKYEFTLTVREREPRQREAKTREMRRKVKIKDVEFKKKTRVTNACLIGIVEQQPKSKKRENIKITQVSKIVGFEEKATTLIDLLNEQSNTLKVISIFGMPGIGKTTLASKIFHDSRVVTKFPTRIWVDISDHDLDMEKVLLTILSKLDSETKTHNMSEVELVNKVKGHLESGKYLIVMDGVWSSGDPWDKLKSFLSTSNTEGRVLISCGENGVADLPNNVEGTLYELSFLTPKDGWKLLQYEVYDDVVNASEELETVGQKIAKQCDGVPLAIVVIAGILKIAAKIAAAQSDERSIEKEWKDVSTRLKTHLDSCKEDKGTQVLRFCYEELPHELKDCFLYLGGFPKGAHIPAKKLTLLWIAEGFIPVTPEKTLEETASDYLKDLINRNLVIVEEVEPIGEPKKCRVQDTVRQFCISESKIEYRNIFQEVRWFDGIGLFHPSDVGKYRRLCIHSYVHDFFSKKPQFHKARTFLSLPKSPITLVDADISPVTKAFHFIRVLDTENIIFPKFSKKLTKLIHLRYLTLTLDQKTKSLPEVMSNLWNLQTLVVDTPTQKLDIKADIWIMRNMRHLKTKSSIVLKKGGKGKGNHENLQTLDRLSPESCTEEVFKKASNLVKLGIQGDLSSSQYSVSLEMLKRVKKLKLVHQADNIEASQAPLSCCLPDTSKFPPKLKILVLTRTCLGWERMSVLMSLGSLEQLKLKDNAFTGESWAATCGGFHTLKLLDIEKADVMTWEACEDAFPQLRFLVLKNCHQLKEVPLVLGKTLKMLSLEHATPSAVSSAEEIKKTKGADFIHKVAPAGISPQP